jgi:site-specific recombinase XerD
VSTEELIKLRDGEVVLYRRANSNRWQARFKLPDNKWHRISTKRSNLDEAKRIASEAYDRARFRRTEGLAAVSKRFRDVAHACIARLDQEAAVGRGKLAYTDYKQAINNYLIPYFANKHIDNISQEDITALSAWRQEKMQKIPAKSTLMNHNAALKRVFQTALDEGWVTKNKVPILIAEGKKSLRRPDFTPAEWITLIRKLPSWVRKAKTERNLRMRELMRDYVMILAKTGIRTGKEAYQLKWKQVRWYVDAEKFRYLAIAVNGKTGMRELIARHGCEIHLKRIQSRFPDLARLSFDDLLKSNNDEYVFRLSNGQTTTELHHTFSGYLKEIGLLDDKYGNQRTLYSLRHMYATSRLVFDKLPIHQLAKQMGTSVAMIEKHYSHLEPLMIANALGGKRYPEQNKAIDAASNASNTDVKQP